MENKQKISRYPVPKINDLPQDLQETLAGATKTYGFTPNVLLALAHRPAELRAFLTYNDALTNKESWLTPKEREMMIIAFSGYNGCNYCVASHGAALTAITDQPWLSIQLAVNYHEADISDREKAILDFAMKVTTESKTIEKEDFEILKSHGLSDEDIRDIAGFTAFYNLSNRMMNFLAVKPDNEFYKN